MYTVLRHRADIYNKTAVVSASGQKKPNWSLGFSDIQCHFIPRRATVRLQPTYDETEHVTLFFQSTAPVDYGKRIYNVKDKFGNIIEAGPMEIVAVLKHPGYTGKIRHIFVTAKRVIE
jgi:hypothetical protein